MKKTLISTLVAAACALGLPAAQAQVSDGIIKIGVLTDMSSLYTDLSGKGSETAARFAIEDFQKTSKAGLKVEVVSADHQNKPDVGSNVARQWYDVDKVDVIVDTPNSGVALAVNQITREKGKAFLVSGAATAELTGKSCSPNTIQWHRQRHCQDRWRHLVLPDRRLRLRPGTRARYRGSGAQEWRQSGGQGAASAEHPGLLVVPAAGAVIEGQDHRSGQCRR
jgi:hypothetical protein